MRASGKRKVNGVLSLDWIAKVRGLVCRRKDMTTTQTLTRPSDWTAAWRAFEFGTTTVNETPEPQLVEDDRPTFEIHLDGRVFASSQCPAKAKALFDQMTSGASAKRYGDTGRVTFVVRNDRRSNPR